MTHSLDTIHYQIAQVCHEANRAYCETQDDFSQLPWEEAPEWQRNSAINGVVFAQDNPDADPGTMHDMWAKEKLEDGWTYGEVKDADARTHPCLVPFEELDFAAQQKDHLFLAIVKALI